MATATHRTNIHPSAVVSPRAQIGYGCYIGPYSIVGDDVVLGDSVRLESHCVIDGRTTVGAGTHIFPFVSIGLASQDLKYKGEPSTVTVGDNTTIREFVTVHRATKDSWVTKVGKNCLIMAYSHIAHDCIIGNNCIMSNNTQVAGHVIMGDWAILGGMCAVHQFVQIGQHAFVSGGSLVGKDVPPYIKAGRVPLSYAGVNSVGLKRRGFTVDKINHILEIYRIIYNKGMNTSQALEYLEEEFAASDERDEIVTFIRESNRGIIKRYTKGSTDDDIAI